MSAKIIADLHTHTTASDGECSPRELVDRAIAAGLEALAITDHDSADSVVEASDYAKTRGIEIIPGCELTIYECSMELHLLGLFIDLAPGSAFQKLLSDLQRHRAERASRMVRQLQAAGFEIEESDVLEAARGAKSIGKPHVAAALIKRGHARTTQDAMLRFLNNGKPGAVPKFKLPPKEGIDAIHASGGVAILAHPGRTQHDELIGPLFRLGMDGVEALYRSHSEVLRRFYSGLARRYEKLVSGGSDFHGPRVTPHIQVGDGGVDRATLERLRQAAEKQAQLRL